MEKTYRFWDRVADKYAKQPVADPDAYEIKLKRTQSYFTPESTVFEFGCGTGTTALIHAPHVKHILATDVSEKMIAIGKSKLAASEHENVVFEQCKLSDIKDKAGSFDVVMGHSILHLLPDMEAAIAKAHELLKPGGVFISSTVCLGEKWFAAPLIGGLTVGRWFGRFPFVRAITIKELEGNIQAGGFEILESTRPGKADYVCFIIARKV